MMSTFNCSAWIHLGLFTGKYKIMFKKQWDFYKALYSHLVFSISFLLLNLYNVALVLGEKKLLILMYHSFYFSYKTFIFRWQRKFFY